MSTEYEYIPANMCFNAEHETNFAELDMDTMKAMVTASNPGEVHDVSRGWGDVYTQLVGGKAAEGSGGGGGIGKIFADAVTEVLKDWEGETAEKFQAESKKVSKKISDCAEYARYTSIAMHSAASVLEKIKPEVEAMEKPSALSSAADRATDWNRDDSGLKRDLGSRDKTTQEALDGNRGDLSKGKEAQLEMAVKMEQLGGAYASQSKTMGTWKRSSYDGHEEYPGEPGGTAPVPAVLPAGGSSPKPVSRGPVNASPKGPGFTAPGGIARPAGIAGGVGSAPKPGSQIGTGLNGVSGGLGVGGGLGRGATGGSLGGGGGGAGGAGAGSGAAIPGGAPGGIAGGTARGGAGAGTRGGRAGMPGMGGGAGAGAGAGAKGAGGRGGGLARQRGGVVDAAKGKSGAGAQGGSGLHRSRGGTQAGGTGTGRGAGMAGAPGSRGGNSGEEKERGQRPDYLVEDEETWATERNVAPRVIE